MIRTVLIRRWPRLARWLPADVYLWVKAVLLAAVAVQLARLVWVLLTPAGPFGEWRPAQARVLPPQAQSAVIAAVDPFDRGAASAAPSMPDLDLELFGTREDHAGGVGSAIIGPPDGEQKSYLVGEEVAPGATLAAVFFDHVVLDRGGGRQQTLTLDSFGSGSMASDAGIVAASGGQPAQTAVHESVLFAPRMDAGRVTGVVVGPKGDPKSFAALGFRPGDVVVAVNGVRIMSQADVAQLQSSIASGARLSLMVERGAETVPIALNLEGR